MNLALRIYAWALRLYPRDFRDQHSQAMLETYTDALKDASLHKRLPAFHRHMTLDLISSLPAAHFQGANMDIWMRRLLIASSLVIGLIELVQTLSMWSEQPIKFPITISSGQPLEPRVALWWTLQQWTPLLMAAQLVGLAIFALGLFALGILSIRRVNLERRWTAAPPFIIALILTLIVASTLSVRNTPNTLIQISFTLMFALGWIALALSLRLKPQPRVSPELSSPRV